MHYILRKLFTSTSQFDSIKDSNVQVY